MNCWFLFGALLSTSVVAQQVTNAPPAPLLGATSAEPAAAAPATNAPGGSSPKAPAKKAGKKPTKPAAKKKDAASELRTVPLVPGPAVVDANNVNVRGQAKLNSEVVGRLTKGEAVTVLQEIVRNSGPDEPSAWAKILLPTNTHVWVNASLLETNNKVVRVRKMNVRGGPGENYSVLGTMSRGESVVDTGVTKNGWLQIQPPTNAYAFVAAQYLKQEAPGATPTTTSPEKPVDTPPVAVTDQPTVAAAPTDAPVTTPSTPEAMPSTNATPEVAAGTTNAAPVVEEPPPKRIVARQGIVRGTTSIQAPTKFALFSMETGRVVDYLYTTSPNLDLSRYKGLQIIVSGEEGLEERWGNTPVITIQKIQVLE